MAALTVWRMTKPKFASSAFSGDGARLYGGRWNPKGVSMVYTASTQSLATLELFVQDSKLQAHYLHIPALLPAKLKIEHVDLDSLPEDWRNITSCEYLRKIGAEWILRASSAVLSVPSSVIPSERNYLLNPSHPDFIKIKLGKGQMFETDLRLLRTSEDKAT